MPPSELTLRAFETALRTARQLLCRVDPESGALLLGGAVEALTGRPASAFSSVRDLLDAVHPKDRARLAALRPGPDGRPGGEEGTACVRLRLVHPDGSVLPCEASATLLEDGPLEHGPLEHGPLEHGPLEHGALEHGAAERAADAVTPWAPGSVVLVRALAAPEPAALEPAAPEPVALEQDALEPADVSACLATLIDHFPDCVSVHATDGRCLSMNAAGRRLLGIGHDEDVRRLALADIIADDTPAPAHLLLSEVMSHGSHSTEAVMVNRRHPTRVPAAWSASVIGEKGGSARRVVCVARDLSAQLAIERELRRSQRRLTHALDVSRLGEWSMDVRTLASAQSRRVSEIFGYGADAAEAWDYRMLLGHIHPDDRERVDRAFTHSLGSGEDLDFEARIVRRDGDLRWISIRASTGPSMSPNTNRGLGGEGPHVGGVIQDITTRKFAEQRDRFLADVSVPLNTLVDVRGMLEQVARLVVPFLADHCGMDLVTSGGALERVAATSSLLEDGVLGKPSAEVAHPPPERLRDMLDTERPLSLVVAGSDDLEGIVRTRSERLSLGVLHVRAYLGVPLVLHRRPLGIMHFYRVGPEARYGEQDLRVGRELAARVAVALENARLYRALQDSDQRKDEFLAMLSHELRNPLESLGVGISLLESGAEPSQRGWAQGMMRAQVSRLSDILEDLLDASRYTFNKVALRREAVALGPLLVQAVGEMRSRAEASGYRVVLDVAAAPLHAELDATRFGQVVSNLLVNALKYGGARGEIRVSLAREADDAVVAVADQGVGLEGEELAKVFELFSQIDATIDRSHGGLGVGLTLVRRIVEMHGGSVVAESAGRGRGTRFVVRLPALSGDATVTDTVMPEGAMPEGSTSNGTTSEEEVVPDGPMSDGSASEGVARRAAGRTVTAQVPSDGSDARLDGGARRLMLVDDNLETVTVLQKLFTMQGYDVRTASDGLAALELADAFVPEAAVLDIGLPGASGHEVASALRERYGTRPLLLIALSGYGQQKDRERARAAGFDHHLLKPANFRSIVDLLEAR